MFHYFENFIDPYSEHTQTDTPPTTLWAFLRGYCRPFYGLLALITLTEMSIAALELGVIFGVGWFVDVIHTTPNLIVDYAFAFVFGALLMLLQTDARLILPLLVWLLLYSLLMRWTIRRVAKASKTASAARSALNGRIIDGYTNIHSVKMFAHDKAELGYVKQGMETARSCFSKSIVSSVRWRLHYRFLMGC